MVKTKESLIGKVFGRLTVLSQAEDHISPSGRRYDQWWCQCSCGSDPFIVAGSSLRYGNHTRSCGCLDQETKASRATKHGDSYTKLYRIYISMIRRCHNVNDKRYHDYGERGISVCQEWKNNYVAFKKWAINAGYQEGLSIDRKDNNKGYCPENCRWATPKIQSNNMRKNHIIEYNGQQKTIAEWADITGISYNTLYGRLYRGWTVTDALTKPVG